MWRLMLYLLHPPNPAFARKIEILGGQQGFNLEFYFRRKQPISKDEVIACGVKHVPITGYRANDETRAMTCSADIEIAFRPVPNAGPMMPDGVPISTITGSILFKAQRVDIRTSDPRRTALMKERAR